MVGTRATLIPLFVAALVSIPAPIRSATDPPAPFVGDGDNAPFGFDPNLLEVTFRDRPSQAERGQFLRSEGLTVERYIPELDGYILRITNSRRPPERVRELRGHPRIRTVSVVPFGRAAALPQEMPAMGRAPAYAPDDPYFPSQWNLARLQTGAAWDVSRAPVTIGIVDTGMNGHSDLGIQGNVNFSSATHFGDDCGTGHGTAMAGIATARTGNASGIAGVSGGAAGAVYNIKVVNGCDGTTSDRIAQGIAWGKDRFSVLNVSLVAGWSPLLEQAVSDAWNRGTVVIASTGNLNQNGFSGNWPGASPHAISVGGTNQSDRRWCKPCGDPGLEPGYVGSNYGVPGVNVAAPSTYIYVTQNNGTVAQWSYAGTSGAAAHVSGIAALLYGGYGVPHGAGADASQFIRGRLQTTADKLGGYSYNWRPGQSSEIGFGRINAYRAMTASAADDVLWYEAWNSGSIRGLVSTGSSLADTGSWITGRGRPDWADVGDVNGDGLADVFWYEAWNNGSISVLLSNGSSLSFQGSYTTGRGKPDWAAVADVNGDGRSDVLWYEAWNNGSIRALLSTGSALSDSGNWITGRGKPDWAGVGDANRDGRADVFWYEAWNNGSIRVLRSTGTSLADSGNWITGRGKPDWAGVGDANRDGRADVFWYEAWNNGSIRVLRSTGISLADTGNWITGRGKPDRAFVTDANRDGRADVYWYEAWNAGSIRALLSTGLSLNDGGNWISGRGGPDWASTGGMNR